MKFPLFSFFMIALVYTTSGATVFWGSHTGKTLLSEERIVRPPRTGYSYLFNVEYPKPGQNNKNIIVEVEVYDNFKNVSGAFPNLVKGGPGFTYAVVSLRSKYEQGVDSTIKIWAK